MFVFFFCRSNDERSRLMVTQVRDLYALVGISEYYCEN